MLLGSPFVLKVGERSSRAQRDTGIPPCPINGVPPFGCKTQIRTFMDPDLLRYSEVWAAAGTWHDVFAIEPSALLEFSNAVLVDLRRDG